MNYTIRLYTLERDYVWTHDFETGSNDMARSYAIKLLTRMALHYQLLGKAELWGGMEYLDTYTISMRAIVERDR